MKVGKGYIQYISRKVPPSMLCCLTD